MLEIFEKLFAPLIAGHSLQDALMIYLLVAARLVAVINMVPFLGSKNAPPQLKLGLALLLSAVLGPFVLNHATLAPPNLLVYLIFLLKEVFVGFTIGFVTAQIFYAVEMMGQIVDVVRGTNQAQLLVPELQERSSAFGDFNYQFLLVVFLTIGLHVPFFTVLAESFIKIPILSFTSDSADAPLITDFFATLLSNIFLIAASLAFPIALVCFLSDLAFGLLNRVAPQINAYFMSMPAKAAGGMIIFLAAFSMIAEEFVVQSKSLLSSVSTVINLLR